MTSISGFLYWTIGVLNTGEYVTVEEFVPGTFVKYLNNDGRICGEVTDMHKKASSLVHFSFIKSNKKLMVVDIQGCGHSLFDPEIASSDLFYNNDKYIHVLYWKFSWHSHQQFLERT